MKDVMDLMARIFLSLIFLWEAYDSIKYFKTAKASMTGYGITWRQDLLLGGAIFLMIFGGILILTGYRSKLGAILLLLFYMHLMKCSEITNNKRHYERAENLNKKSKTMYPTIENYGN